jgi:hypothetical protein
LYQSIHNLYPSSNIESLFFFYPGQRKNSSEWTNESLSQYNQEKISFEMQVQPLTEKLLAAAANTQSNDKAENTSLKKK